MTSKDPSKARAAMARSAALSPDDRRKIATKAASARWDKAKEIPQTAYTGELHIGELSFPCSVLSDGTRILTQSDFMEGMGMYYSGWVAKNRSAEDTAAEVPQFLSFKSLKPFVDRHLGDLQSVIVKYRTERGAIAHGIKAEIIPKICDVWLDADEEGKLGPRQKKIARNARILIRALAHVGIVALVDEATGYQRDRASDALAKILEAFVAKELQPWVKTFSDEYYEELFRLRGLNFQRDTVKRPQYFGHLTNDIIYKRLAPGVLEELKSTAPKTPAGRRKGTFAQKLTPEIGHPKLREHLASVTTIMSLSDDYDDFKKKLDKRHPKLDLTAGPDCEDDDGRGALALPPPLCRRLSGYLSPSLGRHIRRPSGSTLPPHLGCGFVLLRDGAVILRLFLGGDPHYLHGVADRISGALLAFRTRGHQTVHSFGDRLGTRLARPCFSSHSRLSRTWLSAHPMRSRIAGAVIGPSLCSNFSIFS